MRLFFLYKAQSKVLDGKNKLIGWQDDYFFAFAKYYVNGISTYACLSTFQDKMGWHRVDFQRIGRESAKVRELTEESKRELTRNIFIYKSWYTIRP